MSSAYAEENITLKGIILEKGIRILFESNHPVKPRASLEKDRVNIFFTKAYHINLSDMLVNLAPAIHHSHISNEGAALSFQIKEKTALQLKNVRVGKTEGIDILFMPPASSVASPTPPKPIKETLPLPLPVLKRTLPVKVITQREVPSVLKLPSTLPDAISVKPVAKIIPEKEASIVPPPVIPDAVKTPSLTSITPPATVSQANNQVSLSFSWDEEVRAASFIRGNYVWVVFDHYKDFNLKAKLSDYKGYFSDVISIPNREYTILLLERKEKKEQWHLYKDKKSWILTNQEKPQSPSYPIIVTNAQDLSETAYVFTPLEQKPPILRVLDPIVRDQLFIIPIQKEGSYIPQIKRFLDFVLPATLQGMAILPASERLTIDNVDKGLHISTPINEDVMRKNKMLPIAPKETPVLPKNPVNDVSILQDGKKKTEEVTEAFTGSLLPTVHSFAEEWKHDINLVTERHLLSDIITSGEKEKNTKRLALAHYFFLRKLYAETTGTITQIMQYNKDPDVYYKSLFLDGASQYLMGHYEDALALFQKIPKAMVPSNSYREVNFWIDMTQARLGNKETGVNYNEFLGEFLSEYPAYIKRLLAFHALDHMLKRYRLDTDWGITPYEADSAKRTLASVDEHADVSHAALTYKGYLEGLLLLRQHKKEEALQKWEGLKPAIEDRFNRASIGVMHLKTSLALKKLTPQETLQRLSKIRYIWRSGPLGNNIMELLGTGYLQDKNYLEALRAWREIITSFPDTEQALLRAKDMSELFVYLFNKNGANALPDLDALALYYEFRDLTPIGKEGDLMIQNLADRLIKVDLLDRAIYLLKYEIENRLRGINATHVGTQLAFVYLLNKQPDKALEIFDKTIYPGLAQEDPELCAKRKYLKSQIFLELAKYSEALAVLQDDFGKEAFQLRSDIYWAQKDWVHLTRSLERYFAKRSRDVALTQEDEKELLRLALALFYIKDQDRLQDLYKSWSPVFTKDSVIAPIFTFIAHSPDALDYTKLTETSGVGQLETFLDYYKKQVREKGLSSL